MDEALGGPEALLLDWSGLEEVRGEHRRHYDVHVLREVDGQPGESCHDVRIERIQSVNVVYEDDQCFVLSTFRGLLVKPASAT